MRFFVVTADLGSLKSPTMKILSALFLPFLIFCSPLSSQDFLSIHISDVASNTEGVRTNIDLSHQDVDSVQSELKIATILMAADLDYFLTIDKSTPYHYSNNVNLKQFNVSTNEAFVVISGTGVIDGKYIIDEYWGELDLLSQSNWGRISISGSINVPFQGLDHQLRLSSPHLETSSNIFNTPLQSIDFSGFTPFTSYDVGYIETQNNIATVERNFYSDSYFQIGSFASAQAAINSYNIDSDLLDSDGDGYAVWRDDDDNNPSITQANAIYTLSSALTEIASLESQKSSLIAERDARPTQASYDTVVAERDAMPTQASYDAMVAERDAKTEQFSTLDSRVNEILPKEVPDPPQLDLNSFNQLFDQGRQMIEESKYYAQNDYHYVDYKIGRVEGFIANGPIEDIGDELDDIIDELDLSPLTYSGHYNFVPVKEKFEQAKNVYESGNIDSFNQLFDQGRQMIEESKYYAQNDYHYVDYKIGRVEGFIANGPIEDIGDELDDIIDELDLSPLTYSGHYNFIPVKEKFEQAESDFALQMGIQNAYDPTPVVTATLEEHITNLNSDITTARQERDAKLSLEEIVDLRAGSSMVAISNGQATLSMEVEESSDLGIWTTGGTASVQMNVQPGEDKKFFRFKMTE